VIHKFRIAEQWETVFQHGEQYYLPTKTTNPTPQTPNEKRLLLQCRVHMKLSLDELKKKKGHHWHHII